MNNDEINILYTLERGIVLAYQDDPSLTDHAVKRAYEAAASRARALATGHTVKEPSLDEPEASLYAVLVEKYEALKSDGVVDMTTKAKGDPASAETLHQCLKKLVKSVEKATKRSGVRGYLNFIAQYVKG